MDLQLKGRTVLVLGPGDYLDRTIVRALASEGAATLATTSDGYRSTDLAQHADGAPHWTSVEPHIDESASRRLRSFLEEQDHPPHAVVLHVDVMDAITSRGPIRWWKLRREYSAELQSTAEAVIAALPQQGFAQIVLLYRMTDDQERETAMSWLEKAMSATLERATSTGVEIRVNGVLVGSDAAHAEAADIVALLCSPVGAGVSGAIIPVDNGGLAAEYYDPKYHQGEG